MCGACAGVCAWRPEGDIWPSHACLHHSSTFSLSQTLWKPTNTKNLYVPRTPKPTGLQVVWPNGTHGAIKHIYMSAGIKECVASTLTHGATSSPYVFVDQDYNLFRNLSFLTVTLNCKMLLTLLLRCSLPFISWFPLPLSSFQHPPSTSSLPPPRYPKSTLWFLTRRFPSLVEDREHRSFLKPEAVIWSNFPKEFSHSLLL